MPHPWADGLSRKSLMPMTTVSDRSRSGRSRSGRCRSGQTLLKLACWLTAFAAGIGAYVFRSNASDRTFRVVPAEFDHHESMLFAWDPNLEPHESQAVIDLLAEVEPRARIYMLVRNAQEGRIVQARMRERGAAGDGVRFLTTQHRTLTWARDFGPLTVRTQRGLELIEAGQSNPNHFIGLGKLMGDWSTLAVTSVPLVLDGGNLLTNGAGLCLTTEQTLTDNKWSTDDPRRLAQMLRKHLGTQQLVVLDSLFREETGHVDMFATFTAPDTVVVAQCDRDLDMVNSKILDANARKLAGLRTPCGPLKVVRMPMYIAVGNPFATYTNVVYANGKLIVPHYQWVPKEMEEEVLAIYRRLLPSWEIVTVDASSLVLQNGALHCTTMNFSDFRLRTETH